MSRPSPSKGSNDPTDFTRDDDGVIFLNYIYFVFQKTQTVYSALKNNYGEPKM